MGLGLVLMARLSPRQEPEHVAAAPAAAPAPTTLPPAQAATPSPAPTTPFTQKEIPSPPSKRRTAVPLLVTEAAEAPSPGGEAPRPTNPTSEASPAFLPKLWFWLGGGIALISDKQTSTDQTNLNYESATPSAMSLGFGMLWSSPWGIEGSFSSTPGRVSSEGKVAVNQGAYRWEVASLDILHVPNPLWKVRVGLQRQSLPLFVPNLAGTEISVTENQIDMASIGFTVLLAQKDPWETSIDMKYQRPLSQHLTSGQARLDLSPLYSFEGSINQTYHFPGTPYGVGVSWSGQAVHQDFKYDNGSVILEGNQQIFRSTIEGRIYISF